MSDSELARILIVDDQPEIRRLLSMTLAPEPFALSEAADGATAWRLAQSLRPALILLDIGLPGELDGLAVCRRVRADPALAGTRVLLLTGLESKQALAQVADVGADGLLAKPLSPLALLERIEALMAPPGRPAG